MGRPRHPCGPRLRDRGRLRGADQKGIRRRPQCCVPRHVLGKRPCAPHRGVVHQDPAIQGRQRSAAVTAHRCAPSAIGEVIAMMPREGTQTFTRSGSRAELWRLWRPSLTRRQLIPGSRPHELCGSLVDLLPLLHHVLERRSDARPHAHLHDCRARCSPAPRAGCSARAS